MSIHQNSDQPQKLDAGAPRREAIRPDELRAYADSLSATKSPTFNVPQALNDAAAAIDHADADRARITRERDHLQKELDALRG